MPGLYIVNGALSGGGLMRRRSVTVLSLVALLLACSTGTPPVEQDEGTVQEVMDLSEAKDSRELASEETAPEVEVLVSVCPDKICQPDESCTVCPDDCGPCCGNGQCDLELAESCVTCPEDCGACPPACNDGKCDDEGDGGYVETCSSCPQDCGECPPECGNGKLESGEACDDANLENGDGCDDECQVELPPEHCPNSTCEPELGEDCSTCPEDCKDCCDDGLCDESAAETCLTCPEDCGVCPGCGDGALQLELGEQCDDGNNDPDDGCSEACQIEIGDFEPGTILITEVMKDPEMVGDPSGEWIELYNPTETDIDINGWTLQDEGTDAHTILAAGGVVVQAEAFFVLGRDLDPAENGGVDVSYVYSGFKLANEEDEIILKAGDQEVDAVKYDSATFPQGKGKSLTLSADKFGSDLNDFGANWCDGQVQYGKGDWGTPGKTNPDCNNPAKCGNFVTEFPEECDDGNFAPGDGCDAGCQKEPVCGDGLCDADGEGCESCPQDCGECPVVCGDGKAEGDEGCDDGDLDDCNGCRTDCSVQACGDGACDCQESCLSCPSDCGECCPNGKCDQGFGETCLGCPADCGQCCPNAVCDADLGETCQQCPEDCGPCPSVCGNLVIEAGEDCEDGNLDSCDGCSDACRIEECGEGTCSCGEDCFNCAQDCGGCCGDGQCNASHGDTCATCPQDCGPCCTNGICEVAYNETCGTCAADCGECPPVCGDLLCNGTEVCATCPQDCSPCCGDNVCNGTEKCTTCPADCGACPVCGDKACNGTESCMTCPGDCGTCSGWCALSGVQGQTVSCDISLAAKSSQNPKAAALQLTLNYDGSKVSMSKLLCPGGTGDPLCTTMATQHQVTTDPASPASWGGVVKIQASKSGVQAPLSQAYLSGGQVIGQAKILSVTFTLKQSIPQNQAVQVTVTGAKGTDTGGAPLDVALQNGLLITSGSGPQVVCGDGACSGGENCQTCPADCGSCCGNLSCDLALGETCSTCPADCGACPVCGDKACSGGENCATCPGDCGKCPVCGDKACNGIETCQTCPADCGNCCGNGKCDTVYGETCSSCTQDCGACPVCGDKACNGTETCKSCPSDCGNCCGNGKCDTVYGETCNSCPSDCGNCCGNGKCDTVYGETCASCSQDCGSCLTCPDGACTGGETCQSCPADCGACPAGGWCSISGNQGSTVLCDVKLAAATAASKKATGLQFKINYDAAMLGLSKLSCENAGLDFCDAMSILPSGHTLAVEPPKVSWNGLLNVLIYYGQIPPKTITDAHMSGAQVVGTAKFMTLVFTLKQSIPAQSPVQVSLSDTVGTDAEANSLSVSMQDGILITTP